MEETFARAKLAKLAKLSCKENFYPVGFYIQNK